MNILPCPFCGVIPTLKEFREFDEGYLAIECNACPSGRFCGVHGDEEADVLAMWNTRFQETSA